MNDFIKKTSMPQSSRAVVVSFHRYKPHAGRGYRVLFEYFLKNLPLWAGEFDRLYIIDSAMGLDNEDIKALKKIKPETGVFSVPQDEGWIPYKWILPKIGEENILFLDHDVIINKAGVVDEWFKAVESGFDCVLSFDSSGGLREQIHKRFWVLKQHNHTRMGSYYFLLTKRLLRKIGDFDLYPVYYDVPTYIPELGYTAKVGDWMDSFGHFTLKLLVQSPKIKTIEDDRSTIYLMEGNQIIREPETAKNLGYYHIRNGNLANYAISSRQAGLMRQYNEVLTNNPRELLRSLAWFYHMADYEGDVLVDILKDMDVRYKAFLNYFEQFEHYHNLV